MNSDHPETTPAATFIAASDYVLANCAAFGAFHPKDYLKNFNFRKYESALSEQHWDEIVNKQNFNPIVYFMRDEQGFIKEAAEGTPGFRLTPTGRDVKMQGGYEKYLKFIRERDDVVFKNLKWTKGTFFAIMVYVVLTAIIAFATVKSCNIQEKSQTSKIK